MKKVLKTSFLIGVYMFIYSFVQITITYLNISINMLLDKDYLYFNSIDSFINYIMENMNLSASIIIPSIITIFIYYLIFKAREMSIKDYKYKNKLRPLDYVSSILFVISLSIIVTYMITNIEFLRIRGDEIDEMFKYFYDDNIFLNILAIGVLGPIVEEIIFRGLIYSELKRAGMKILPAIIIQGILFGIFHGNIYQATYATIIGIILGITIERSQTIYMPILIHMIYNIVVGFVQSFNLNLIYIIVAINLLIIAFALILPREKNIITTKQAKHC